MGSHVPSVSPSDIPTVLPSMNPTVVITPISPFLTFMDTATSKDKFIFSVLCIILTLCFTMCFLIIPMYLCKVMKKEQKKKKTTWFVVDATVDGKAHQNIAETYA